MHITCTASESVFRTSRSFCYDQYSFCRDQMCIWPLHAYARSVLLVAMSTQHLHEHSGNHTDCPVSKLAPAASDQSLRRFCDNVSDIDSCVNQACSGVVLTVAAPLRLPQLLRSAPACTTNPMNVVLTHEQHWYRLCHGCWSLDALEHLMAVTQTRPPMIQSPPMCECRQLQDRTTERVEAQKADQVRCENFVRKQ